MCFIKFSNQEESFKAMAYMHGCTLFGRKLYMTFTRVKI